MLISPTSRRFRFKESSAAARYARVVAQPAPETEVLTWSGFGEASRELAALVAESGYQPGIILGIARGGLIPAATIAYALDVKNVFMMSVEFYAGVDERLDFPVMLPPLLSAVDIAGARVLVVDDVADTGGTLKLVNDFCSEHVNEVRCAVLYEKPRSVVKCEYVWRRTDRWVTFPWSSQPPVVERVPSGSATERSR